MNFLHFTPVGIPKMLYASGVKLKHADYYASLNVSTQTRPLGTYKFEMVLGLEPMYRNQYMHVSSREIALLRRGHSSVSQDSLPQSDDIPQTRILTRVPYSQSYGPYQSRLP